MPKTVSLTELNNKTLSVTTIDARLTSTYIDSLVKHRYISSNIYTQENNLDINTIKSHAEGSVLDKSCYYKNEALYAKHSIPAGTLLGIYQGKGSDSGNTDYIRSVDLIPLNSNNTPRIDEATALSILGKNNMAKINHAYTNLEDYYGFRNDEAKELATSANIIPVPLSFTVNNTNGKRIILCGFITRRDIEANEVLLSSYVNDCFTFNTIFNISMPEPSNHDGYWQHKYSNPSLYDKNGNPLSPALYYPKTLYLTFENTKDQLIKFSIPCEIASIFLMAHKENDVEKKATLIVSGMTYLKNFLYEDEFLVLSGLDQNELTTTLMKNIEQSGYCFPTLTREPIQQLNRPSSTLMNIANATGQAAYSAGQVVYSLAASMWGGFGRTANNNPSPTKVNDDSNEDGCFANQKFL